MRPPVSIRTLTEVRTVVVLSDGASDGTGDLTRTASVLLRRGAAADGICGGVDVLLGQDDAAVVLSGDNTNALVVDNARALVAVERLEVTRLAREHATKALLLHEEAVVLANDEPLEILRRHGGVCEEGSGAVCNNYNTHVSAPDTCFDMTTDARSVRGVPVAPFVVRAR